MMLTKAPVFVVGHAKTGTTLFRSLLDGHPDLLTYPIELKFFSFAPFDMKLSDFRGEMGRTPDQTAHNLLNGKFFQAFLEKRLPRAIHFDPDSVIDTGVDPEKYLEWYLATEFTSYRDVFLRHFSALLYSRGENPEDLQKYHIVEKTPFQEEHASILAKWFPNAIFFHLVRNPYATYTTLCLRKGSKTEFQRDRIIKSMEISHYYSVVNSNNLDNYHVVRYEDLVQDPNKLMNLLCDKIGISYHKTMNEPTISGRPYGGNSMYKHIHSGVDKKSMNRWKEEISREQVETVNNRLKNWLQDYMYDAITMLDLKNSQHMAAPGKEFESC